METDPPEGFLSHEPFDLKRTIILFSEPDGNGIHIGIERVETTLIERAPATPAQGGQEADTTHQGSRHTSDNKNSNGM